MFVAVVFQKQANAVNAVESVVATFTGDTIEEAASSGEFQAETHRKSNGSSYRYRVLAGEITHTVRPPASNITLVSIKK